MHMALPKGFGEFLGADWLVTVLELVEHPLQCQGDTLGGVVTLCGHHVYCLEGIQTMGLGLLTQTVYTHFMILLQSTRDSVTELDFRVKAVYFRALNRK